LTTGTCEPDNNEHGVFVDTLENVIFIMNLAAADHVEELHEYE